jgi:hypothetical protein
MQNPGQSDGCTGQSEAKSVDIVRTSFLPSRGGGAARSGRRAADEILEKLS